MATNCRDFPHALISHGSELKTVGVGMQKARELINSVDQAKLGLQVLCVSIIQVLFVSILQELCVSIIFSSLFTSTYFCSKQ